MAHYSTVLERDALRVCPYNSSHRVSQGRYAIHLMKCKKNNKDVVMETCPYNASHIFPKHEKQDHIATCPFRVDVERTLVSLSHPSLASTEVPNYLPMPDDGGENWDDEVDDSGAAGYDPKKHAKKLQFTSSAALAGMKPAEKRQFHKEWARPRSPSPEPAPVVQAPAPVLCELRPPRANPMVMQNAINPSSIGTGRGQGPAGNAPHRLAANIFGAGVKQENGVVRAPLGRGRGGLPKFVPKKEPL